MPSHGDSYGTGKSDDADVRYEIPTPFHPKANNTEILLFDEGETVEVIIHLVPCPHRYHINYPDPASEERNPSPTEKQVREKAIARWIVDEAIEILSTYDPERSEHVTNSGNRDLDTVYFTCDRNEVNDAVLRSREFVHTVEEKIFRQRQKFRGNIGRCPLKDLERS